MSHEIGGGVVLVAICDKGTWAVSLLGLFMRAPSFNVVATCVERHRWLGTGRVEMVGSVFPCYTALSDWLQHCLRSLDAHQGAQSSLMLDVSVLIYKEPTLLFKFRQNAKIRFTNILILRLKETDREIGPECLIQGSRIDEGAPYLCLSTGWEVRVVSGFPTIFFSFGFASYFRCLGS